MDTSQIAAHAALRNANRGNSPVDPEVVADLIVRRTLKEAAEEIRAMKPTPDTPLATQEACADYLEAWAAMSGL